MAASLNKVCILGNLGSEPDIRSFQNGGKVANLSVATSESWKDRVTGENRERTEWHKVAVFGDALVALVERALAKGSKVYVEGKLQTRKYTDKSGSERYTTEIIVQGYDAKLLIIDGKPRGEAPPAGGGGQGITDEDLPF